MAKYITHCYLIKALTNIHPGSGDENYGTVDKVVQRDPADNLPTIHSSSLKGALREYFKEESSLGESEVKEIFGEEPNAPAKDRKEAKGKYQFFAGHLLSLPVRSTGKPYYNVTADRIIEHLLALCEDLQYSSPVLDELRQLAGAGKEFPFVFGNERLVLLEGVEANSQADASKNTNNCQEYIGPNIAVASEEQMKGFAEELPIIARNQLDNGESKNLWYEEVLPRDTRFYFFLRAPNEDPLFKKFETELLKNVIQIGANATVGYGYCKISKLDQI